MAFFVGFSHVSPRTRIPGQTEDRLGRVSCTASTYSQRVHSTTERVVGSDPRQAQSPAIIASSFAHFCCLFVHRLALCCSCDRRRSENCPTTRCPVPPGERWGWPVETDWPSVPRSPYVRLSNRVRGQSAQLMPEASVALGCFGIVPSGRGVVVVTHDGCMRRRPAPPVRSLLPPT